MCAQHCNLTIVINKTMSPSDVQGAARHVKNLLMLRHVMKCLSLFKYLFIGLKHVLLEGLAFGKFQLLYKVQRDD